MGFGMNQDRLEPKERGAGYGLIEGSGREGEWLSLILKASISQSVVAAKTHVLKPHRGSLRRVQRSADDVCMGVD